jgi:hypothetical protein
MNMKAWRWVLAAIVTPLVIGVSSGVIANQITPFMPRVWSWVASFHLAHHSASTVRVSGEPEAPAAPSAVISRAPTAPAQPRANRDGDTSRGVIETRDPNNIQLNLFQVLFARLSKRAQTSFGIVLCVGIVILPTYAITRATTKHGWWWIPFCLLFLLSATEFWIFMVPAMVLGAALLWIVALFSYPFLMRRMMVRHMMKNEYSRFVKNSLKPDLPKWMQSRLVS